MNNLLLSKERYNLIIIIYYIIILQFVQIIIIHTAQVTEKGFFRPEVPS